MTKKKIIFVDDEPNILDGLRRMLRSLRNEYDMHFASGGREALTLMESDRFDVVVSDMRMPGMDGAELLETIQKKHPHAIRIMLTGQADEQSILRTVGVVHQFLAKPCDPEKLKIILTQTSALQDMLSDGGLKDLISQLGKLPSLPSTYAKLQKAIATPGVEIKEIGEIIAKDIAMTAKVLQLVNSAFFGIYSRVDSPGRAVTLLGLDTIKVLVLGLELFSQIKISEEVFRFDRLWDHSLTVGKVAKAIAGTQSDDKELIGNTFLAGTLHDLGKLILISSLPKQYLRVFDLTQERNITMPEAEKEVFGAGQSAVGSYLVGLWGFTGPIVEAIGFQSCIEKYPGNVFTPTLAVHVANVLYYRNRPDEIIGRRLDINMPVLERLGLQGALGDWETICADIMQDQTE
ncbi:MAG: Response regulator receiver modulated metal dependent phosphohydrolase [uncultured bacterium]|nr:MAG: Response regulator receiver modulated metal dependent phosphohydrolase [uncultured bacterium]